MQKILFNSLLLMCTLTACDVEKPPAPETTSDMATSDMANVPKQIMDKAKSQLNQAEQLNAEHAKALENIEAPANAAQ